MESTGTDLPAMDAESTCRPPDSLASRHLPGLRPTAMPPVQTAAGVPVAVHTRRVQHGEQFQQMLKLRALPEDATALRQCIEENVSFLFGDTHGLLRILIAEAHNGNLYGIVVGFPHDGVRPPLQVMLVGDAFSKSAVRALQDLLYQTLAKVNKRLRDMEPKMPADVQADMETDSSVRLTPDESATSSDSAKGVGVTPTRPDGAPLSKEPAEDKPTLDDLLGEIRDLVEEIEPGSCITEIRVALCYEYEEAEFETYICYINVEEEKNYSERHRADTMYDSINGLREKLKKQNIKLEEMAIEKEKNAIERDKNAIELEHKKLKERVAKQQEREQELLKICGGGNKPAASIQIHHDSAPSRGFSVPKYGSYDLGASAIHNTFNKSLSADSKVTKETSRQDQHNARRPDSIVSGTENIVSRPDSTLPMLLPEKISGLFLDDVSGADSAIDAGESLDRPDSSLRRLSSLTNPGWHTHCLAPTVETGSDAVDPSVKGSSSRVSSPAIPNPTPAGRNNAHMFPRTSNSAGRHIQANMAPSWTPIPPASGWNTSISSSLYGDQSNTAPSWHIYGSPDYPRNNNAAGWRAVPSDYGSWAPMVADRDQSRARLWPYQRYG